MRARSLDLPPFEGARFGVARAVVGIGEVVEPAPGSVAQAAEILAATRDAKAARMLERFAGVPDGTLVWTRTDGDAYRLGQITGPWRYEDSPEALGVGIPHVRPVRWADRELRWLEVPPAVVQTFQRGGRNFQRTHDADAERLTEALWDELGTADP